ncbi:MAG: glycosyltransferase [Bacteroidales bacterium]|jgi:cellulose synthase/poly-beta-1,6-N-acetylglucosamine synthase-like glycosyltransferase|nr:glycosyltransferase [Bacteroidales bacterium]
MEAIFYLGLFIVLLYALTIIFFTLGWFKLKIYNAFINTDYPKITILVACRNEESTIGNLLNSLAKQNYPREKTEIIIVNDHSEDNTAYVIQQFSDNRVHLLNLPEGQNGKKEALRFGLQHATSDIIITTDADCTMNEYWITSLVSYYLQYNPKLLVAPVVLKPCKTVFQKLQSLEFLSLIGSGAGAIGLKRPIMCNGANLLFEKSIFKNNLEGNDYASGDDIFLLLSTKKEDRKSIHYIKSIEAVVYTNPATNLSDFFEQRIRWTSKSKGYRDADLLFTSMVVACTSLILAALLCASAFNGTLLNYYVGLILIKSLADFAMLYAVSKFFKVTKLLWWVIPLQLIYPIYILITVVLGLVGRFEWKNRSFR